MVNFKRKGAVEMSLSLIIMLVIGLTVLGLVIAFVTNMMQDAEGAVEGELSQAEERAMQSVEDDSSPFATGPSSATVNPNDYERFFVKLRNPHPDDTITISGFQDDVSETDNELDFDTAGDISTDGGLNADVDLTYQQVVGDGCTPEIGVTGASIAPGDEEVLTISVDVSDASCQSGESLGFTVSYEVEEAGEGDSFSETFNLNID